jgi:hypothetical protein
LVAQGLSVAKKQTESNPPTSDQSVRLAGDVVRMARLIASVTEESMSKIISDRVRPLLRAEVERLIREGAFLPDPPPKSHP